MVVSSVHIISDASAGPQILEDYQANLESLGAKKSGSFLVECDTYYSNPAIFQQQKILNLIMSSEYPASAFSLIEPAGTHIVADSSFEQIINTLTNFYTPKKVVRMEVRGQKYMLSDFLVKIGSCTMGANFKGVIAEIEYGPCSIPGNCWDLIKELGRTFVGPSIMVFDQPHKHLLAKMNELYKPVDTILQYNDIFNQIKKQQTQFINKMQ